MILSCLMYSICLMEYVLHETHEVCRVGRCEVPSDLVEEKRSIPAPAY